MKNHTQYQKRRELLYHAHNDRQGVLIVVAQASLPAIDGGCKIMTKSFLKATERSPALHCGAMRVRNDLKSYRDD